MNDFSILVLVSSLAISVLGSILGTFYFKNRDNRLRKKLEEINEYEEFIEKLSKGNTRLLRSSLITIFGVLFSISFALILIMLNMVITFPVLIKSGLVGLSLGFLIGAVWISFFQAKSIIQSANLKEAREELAKKRENLKSKLS